MFVYLATLSEPGIGVGPRLERESRCAGTENEPPVGVIMYKLYYPDHTLLLPVFVVLTRLKVNCVIYTRIESGLPAVHSFIREFHAGKGFTLGLPMKKRY